MSDIKSDINVLPVIHYTHDWLPITTNWLYTQAAFLPPSIQVHVVCEKVANLDLFPMPSIYSHSALPSWRIFMDKVIRKLQIQTHLNILVEQIRAQKAKLLHSHFGPIAWQNLSAARKTKIRHVATFYGYDVNQLPHSYPYWRQRYQQLFHEIDRVFCEGSHMASKIAELGCPPEKIQVQHLGIDTATIPFQPRTWQTNEPLRVLIASSFVEKKGIPYALQALAEISKHVDLEITLIGDAPQTADAQREKQSILRTIHELALTDKIRMLGYQPPQVLRQEAYSHHLYLASSVTSSSGDTEGGAPVAIIEMLATGMPVISTSHCDIPEVTGPAYRELLAEERDVAGLIKNIERLLSNPNEWGALCEAGRRHVEEGYDARRQGLRLAAAYRNILEHQ